MTQRHSVQRSPRGGSLLCVQAGAQLSGAGGSQQPEEKGWGGGQGVSQGLLSLSGSFLISLGHWDAARMKGVNSGLGLPGYESIYMCLSFLPQVVGMVTGYEEYF